MSQLIDPGPARGARTSAPDAERASTFASHELACPHCEHRAGFAVALSLDAARADEARRAILDGSFQRFTCAACGGGFRAEGPLAWVDHGGKRWVAVFPPAWEASWWRHEDHPRVLFEENMVERCPPLVRDEWAPGFAIRCVFGLDRLREKLVAWDAGLDDRLLEAFKLRLVQRLGTVGRAASSRPRLHEVRGATAIFALERADGAVTALDVSLAELRAIDADRARWQPLVDLVSRGPYVDLGRVLAPPPADHAPTYSTYLPPTQAT